MAKTIGIYTDSGTAVSTIVRSITQEVDRSYFVRSLVAEHLDDDKVFEDLEVFVMPGGADLPYCGKLNGSRNARLCSWVERGGIYLGLCAGAYYACRDIRFEGKYGKIWGDRELHFLEGTGVGSINEIALPYDLTLQSAAVAQLVTDTGEESFAFYHGGPYFEIEKDASVNVLARYADVKGKPPAIVETVVGKGKVLLSGVHPEVSFKELKLEVQMQDQYSQLLLDLKAVDLERRRLWRSLLLRSGLNLFP